MHAPISTWAINVALRPNLGYDPVTQLTRITQTVRTPNILVVNPQSVPVDDLPGLVAWLKKNAKTAAYPSSGVGSSDHLTGEMFKLATGTDMAACPLFRRRPGDDQPHRRHHAGVVPESRCGHPAYPRRPAEGDPDHRRGAQPGAAGGADRDRGRPARFRGLFLAGLRRPARHGAGAAAAHPCRGDRGAAQCAGGAHG